MDIEVAWDELVKLFKRQPRSCDSEFYVGVDYFHCARYISVRMDPRYISVRHDIDDIVFDLGIMVDTEEKYVSALYDLSFLANGDYVHHKDDLPSAAKGLANRMRAALTERVGASIKDMWRFGMLPIAEHACRYRDADDMLRLATEMLTVVAPTECAYPGCGAIVVPLMQGPLFDPRSITPVTCARCKSA